MGAGVECPLLVFCRGTWLSGCWVRTATFAVVVVGHTAELQALSGKAETMNLSILWKSWVPEIGHRTMCNLAVESRGSLRTLSL